MEVLQDLRKEQEDAENHPKGSSEESLKEGAPSLVFSAPNGGTVC